MRLLGCLALLVAGCAPAELPTSARWVEHAGDAVVETDRAAARDAVLEAGRAAARDAGLQELTFGITPYVDGAWLAERYRPLLDGVSDSLGLPIRAVIGESYEDMETQATEGAVDVAVLPPYAYVRATANAPELRVFATHVMDGSPTYGAYVIALEDGPISQLSDVRGRSFGFVDLRSTSGFLFPADRMLEEGLHPLDDLKPMFFGDHDRVFDAVLAGDVEAGAVYTGGLLDGRRRHALGPRVRVIAKTRRIPSDAYVARPGLPLAVAKAFGQALSEISTRTADGRRRLALGLQLNGFLPVDDRHYDVVREVDARVRRAVPALREEPTAPAPLGPQAP